MRSTVLTASLMLLAGSLTAGCTTKPVAYQDLPAAADLRPVKGGSNAFEFRNPSADLRGYSSIIVEPVTIYAGHDAQFGSTSHEDRRIVADYMRGAFAESLGERYRIATAAAAGAAPGTLRLKLTLTGIETTKPVLATAAHLAPAGAVINAGRQVAGKNGSFFGTVTYAADLTDAVTGARVYSFITQQSPDALDLTATLGTLEAARIGVRIGARHLREDLQRNGMVLAALR